MATPHLRIASTFFVLAVLASPGYAQQPADSTLNRFLAAIPDSQARRFWRDAARQSDLARVAAQLLSFDRPVTPRRIAQLNLGIAAQAVSRRQLRPPRISDSALADVQPFSTDPITEYRGRYIVTDVSRGRVAGRLDSIAAPFELYYKLPGNQPLRSVGPGSRLQLRLLDDSYGMSRRRRVFLTSDTGALLLWYFSDGANAPYRLTLADPPIQIIQQQAAPRAIPTVDVSLGGRSAGSLRPGQRNTLEWQGRRYEVVVLEAAGAPKSREVEGDVFHVTVLLYAVP